MKLNIISTELENKIKECLYYEPNTGNLIWLKSRISTRIGKIAGTIKKNKYKEIRFEKIRYQQHRFAWYLYYGVWPTGCIDHIDGDPSNNKINNLRECTHAQNMQNRVKSHIGSKVDKLGVSKNNNKYRAQISFNCKTIWIGEYITPEEAHCAYLEKKRELHEFCTI